MPNSPTPDPHSDPRQPAPISEPGGPPPRPAGPNDESLQDDLAAEIADHLASAETALLRKGHSPIDAAQLARAHFGDIARIVRQCRWIQQGDQIMIRALTIALLALLTLTVAALTFAGFQAQRTFTTRMDRVSEQLAKLAETQSTVVAQQEQQLPVSISGLAYLGDRSRPAAGAKLTLYQGSPPSGKEEGCTAMRVLEADAAGAFRSGPLPTGVYFVVARLLDTQGTPVQSAYYIQSKPLNLYEANQKGTLELDLLANCRVTLVLAQPIPSRVDADDRAADLNFDFYVGPPEGFPVLPLNPLTPTGQETAWPLFAISEDYHRLPSWLEKRRSQADWPRIFAVPPGAHAVSAFLTAEMFPRVERRVREERPIIGFGQLHPMLPLADGEEAEIHVSVPENFETDLRAALKAKLPVRELERKFRLQLVRATRAR